jgi:hypothetical protein
LEYKPLIKQHIAWKYLNDKKTNEVFYGGSAGGGKTELLCNWVLFSALMYPDTRWLIGRARYTTLSKTTLLSFQNLIMKYNLSDRCKYNGKMHIYEFDNRSLVFFQDLYQQPSDPEYNSLRGYELTGVALDEGAEISIKAFEVLNTRIRYNLKKYDLIPKILICSNPSKNWLYDRYYMRYKNGTLEDNQKYIQAFCEDNIYLPQVYIDNLKSLPENSVEKQIYYYGNWEYDINLLNLFNHEDVVNMFYQRQEEGQKYLTCDIAMSGGDKTVITIWNGYNCEHIYEYKNQDTISIVEEIKRLIQLHKIKITSVILDAIGVGQGVSHLLRGCVAYEASHVALKGEPFMNQRSQLYYKFAELVSQGKIYINTDKKDYICMELEAHKKVDIDKDVKARITPKDKIKQMINRSPDIADALVMRMYFEYKKNKISYSVI